MTVSIGRTKNILQSSDKALLIVDVQNDFCPGGSLVVTQGNRVVQPLNKYIRFFIKARWPIFASRDWHPEMTIHFKQFGGQWPVHCVQNTSGAAFHRDLKLPRSTIIISKGMDPDGESYSAFLGMDSQGNKIFSIIKNFGTKELYVGGLATDYCVKASVLDALKLGFKVKLLIDCIRGVNLKRNDSKDAITEMKKAGAQITTFSQLRRSQPKKIHVHSR